MRRIYFMAGLYWVRIGTGPEPLLGPFGTLGEAERAGKFWE
jgi:hypothetical protein